MSNRAPDWLRQAQADLEHAQASLEDKDFEWSCFAAQQAAEKAINAQSILSFCQAAIREPESDAGAGADDGGRDNGEAS